MMLYMEIGNTNIKFKSEFGRYCSLPSTEESIDIVVDVVMSHQKVKAISVVPKLLDKIIKQTSGIDYTVITNESNFSFEHNIEGVGIDRLVAIEGVLSMYQAPFVLVDIGTAVTIDFVNINFNSKAVFEGGVIFPSYLLAAKSLNKYTAQLPEIDVSFPSQLLGVKTDIAINSGIVYSVSYGVEGIVNDICEKNNLINPVLILTGGGADLLSSVAKNKYQRENDLIFKGMELL